MVKGYIRVVGVEAGDGHRGAFLVFDFAVDYREGAVVAGVDVFRSFHDAVDALGGLLFVPEYQGVFAGEGDAGIVQDIAGDGAQAFGGFDEDGKAAGGMAGGVDEGDARFDDVAFLDFLDPGLELNHRAGPGGGGPVVAVRFVGVFALEGVDQHRGMLEQVVVLAVVPMGVGHYGDVDVLGGEAAGVEGVFEGGAAADVADVDHNALFTLNQEDGAKADDANIGAEGAAVEEDAEFGHCLVSFFWFWWGLSVKGGNGGCQLDCCGKATYYAKGGDTPARGCFQAG